MTAHLLLALLLQALSSTAFYLPGVAPQSWNDGDPVVVEVDSLTSPKTRLPYDYYDFPFCRPEKGVVAKGETLGEIIAGSRTESTGYKIQMATDNNCQVLCKVDMDKDQVLKMKQLIDDQYVINLMVDNLPGAMEMQSNNEADNANEVQFGLGYWVGGIILDVPTQASDAVVDAANGIASQISTGTDSIIKMAKKSATAPRYINNHILLKLFYHVPVSLESYTGAYMSGASEVPVVGAETTAPKNPDGTNAKRIVRFEVHPYSVKHVYDVSKKGEFDPATVSTCSSDSQAPKWDDTLLLNMKNDKGMEVVYSYGVEWISSPTSWATRWDIYLSMNGQTHDDIHWLSITNSILVAVFLTALVALILVSILVVWCGVVWGGVGKTFLWVTDRCLFF